MLVRRRICTDAAEVDEVAGSSEDGVMERRFTSGRCPCARMCSSCVMPRGRCARPRRGLEGGAAGGVGEPARLPRITLRLRSCSSAASAALSRLSEALLAVLRFVNDLSESAEREGGSMDEDLAGARDVSGGRPDEVVSMRSGFADFSGAMAGEAGGKSGEVMGNAQFALGVSLVPVKLWPRRRPIEEAEYVRLRPGISASEDFGSGKRIGYR